MTPSVSSDDREYSPRRVCGDALRQKISNCAGGNERASDILVMQLTNFLERMREGIMSNVVEQSGGAYDGLLLRVCSAESVAPGHRCTMHAREGIRSARVLDA